jgi:hypothetical protein
VTVQVPLMSVLRGTWLNLSLPLAELTQMMFNGAVHRSIETVSISGTARIRRIATMRDSLPLEVCVS